MGSGVGMLHHLFAALETGNPTDRRLLRLPPRSGHRHARRRGPPECVGEVETAGLDRRALFRTGWFSDVILPEATYLERANLLAQMPGPVPVFIMRDQAIAPRFDSRPAWWIFREILRRMGIKEVLDFETIEELWNYQLEGTGVTVAEMHETGSASWQTRQVDAPRKLNSRPLRQDRDRQRHPEEGRPAQSFLLTSQTGAGRRPFQPTVRAPGNAGPRTDPQQPDHPGHRAQTGNLDSPQACLGTRNRRWQRGGGQRRRRLLGSARGQGHPVDPPGCGFHAARLRGHRALGHARAAASEWPTNACNTENSTNSIQPVGAVP